MSLTREPDTLTVTPASKAVSRSLSLSLSLSLTRESRL
jgi:hypothetical protein